MKQNRIIIFYEALLLPFWLQKTALKLQFRIIGHPHDINHGWIWDVVSCATPVTQCNKTFKKCLDSG